MKKQDKIIIVLIAVLILIFIVSKTLSLLQTNITARAELPLANWNILINDTELTSKSTADIRINNIEWDGNAHTSAGVVAPGSTGKVYLEINPTNTSVAFTYTISFIDKVINDQYILTITDIKDDDGSLIKTDQHSYTGLYTLEEIRSRENKTIEIDVEWINDESNNQSDTLVGTESTNPSFIHLEMEAMQYNGETITPYVGG